MAARGARASKPNATAGGEVVEFFGVPTSLSAQVSLVNNTDALRRLRRTIPPRVGPAPRTTSVHRAMIGQRLVLEPGATGQVPVRLTLDRHTAPGDYEVQIELDGVVRPALLHVAEVVDVALNPEIVVIGNQASEQLRSIAVTNTGNVNVTVKSTAAPMDDDRLDCRAFRAALKKFGEPPPPEESRGFDDFMTELARQFNRGLQDAGVLGVRSLDGTITISGGETRVVRLGFTVPVTIDSHSRYSALVPIATDDILVRVVPSVAPE